MENKAIKKPRLEWLDALRGFTMILVVANHVAGMGFGEEWKHSSAIPFLILFRMPLFFFVSGFLAYKASQVWDLKNFGSLVWKKFKVQTIPTVAFFFLAMAILNNKFWPAVESAFHSPLKGGYWFTIALLYMFIIYYVFSYLESKLKWKTCIPITLLFLVSMVFYESNYNYSSLTLLFQYFPFFLYGNIVHRYWDKSQRVMDSKWFFPVVIIVVILATLDYLKWHTLRMTWAVIPLTISRFGLLTITFMYFRHYHQYFTKMTFMGVSLQYIGRRTLDIYLIHFLFMPDLPHVGEFFKSYPHNFVLDIVLSVILGLVIIGFSIITSNILRISPFFKKWLFGRS